MNNKKKFTSFFIALVFTLSLLFNNFTGLISTADVAVAETKVAVNAIDDGAILHAWNWSLNTIKEKLPEIKEAGYKAVQTSQWLLAIPYKRSSAVPIPFDYRLSVARLRRFALPAPARSAPCGFVPLCQSQRNAQRVCRITPAH